MTRQRVDGYTRAFRQWLAPSVTPASAHPCLGGSWPGLCYHRSSWLFPTVLHPAACQAFLMSASVYIPLWAQPARRNEFSTVPVHGDLALREV